MRPQKNDSGSDNGNFGMPGDPLQEVGIDLDKAELETFTAEAKEWPDDDPENWTLVTIEFLKG